MTILKLMKNDPEQKQNIPEKTKGRPRGAKPPQCYDMPKNDVSRILADVMELAVQPKCQTEEEYIERFHWYFGRCFEQGTKPTVEGFCLSMGWCSRATIGEWESGIRGEWKQDFAKKAKLLIQTFLTTATMENKINPVTWIFYGKNYFGMAEKTEVSLIAENRTNFDEETQRKIIDSLPVPK
jgi:hypothetical protein